MTKLKLGSILIAIALSMSFAACEREGPIERAGERADEAVEETRDAVDSGPMERAGERADETTENTR